MPVSLSVCFLQWKPQACLQEQLSSFHLEGITVLFSRTVQIHWTSTTHGQHTQEEEAPVLSWFPGHLRGSPFRDEQMLKASGMVSRLPTVF